MIGIKISAFKIDHYLLLTVLLIHIYIMADDGQTSKLDNAGTLQQSVSTSVIHEKVTIVGHQI